MARATLTRSLRHARWTLTVEATVVANLPRRGVDGSLVPKPRRDGGSEEVPPIPYRRRADRIIRRGAAVRAEMQSHSPERSATCSRADRANLRSLHRITSSTRTGESDTIEGQDVDW